MLKARNLLLLTLTIAGSSMILLAQGMHSDEFEGDELIHISTDGTSLYGQFIPVEALHRHHIEKEAAIYFTSWDGVLTKVAGGKVYLRASNLLSKGQLMVVNPKYEEDAVFAVSSETAIELLQEWQILKLGMGSQEYFHMERRTVTRMAYPGDCTETPHPSEAPHPTTPEENADCHGQAGQLGYCDGGKGNIQWEITCTGLTEQRCTAWVTCADGQLGVDSDGDRVRGINVRSTADAIFAGQVDGQEDKGYFTLMRTYAEPFTVVLDCTR